jgi:hypothetical protein
MIPDRRGKRDYLGYCKDIKKSRVKNGTDLKYSQK